MEIIVTCLRGLEDVCISEIRELVKKKASKLCDGRVKVVGSDKDLEKLSNYLRSGIKICELFDGFDFRSIDDISARSLKFAKDIVPPMAVRCSRSGNHDFNSGDVEKAVGKELFASGLKVDLVSPATTFVVDIINNKCFLGRLIAADLNKRDYRIRTTSQSVNATICYALVRLAKYRKGKLLDPFSKDGSIAIEAAAFVSGLQLKYHKPVESKIQKIYCFDSLLNNVNNSETNAKLAGVNKLIKFARYDIEWLDTKFNKGEIDYLVTALPNYSHDRKKDFEKLVTGLFYQSEFILSKSGKMILLSISDIRHLIEKFKIESERVVTSGNVNYHVFVLVKAPRPKAKKLL